MRKEELIDIVKAHGDSIITYRSLESNKVKYNVCTLDFNTPYILEKSNKTDETADTVLMFCWDADSFRLIRPDRVTSVVPLNSVLKNVTK